jgi:hypothetical protein
MSRPHSSDHNIGQPGIYEIRIKGHLGPQWLEWFEGLAITLEENGDTLLIGPVIDQAALHGLLKKVRDLGMPLLSVNSVAVDQANLVDDDPSTDTQKAIDDDSSISQF